jgi:DNA-binding response OmpR family regulator
MRLTPQKTIVVVEDEQDTAEMFAEMMRLSGYRVLKSFGGNAAIELIRRVQPDAVVLDVMMPDMSGLEVLQALRDDGLLDTLPVIVVSAKSMPADIQTGLDAGASVYLTKPVSFTDLKAAVEKLF